MGPAQPKEDFLERTREQVLKALKHFEKSVSRTENLSTEIDELSDQDLEKWEAFLSRFARMMDLFSSKYLRSLILKEEPGFRGSTKDLLNQAEKLGFIDSARKWMELKELRNRQTHDYEDSDLRNLWVTVRKEIPYISSIKKFLGKE